ncbi:unnamed protein product [Rotaria socialis]|uniref:Uncharacterized protein n=1 Tax=Rotaria socialis TaxID=392032 RepID=A0A821MIQ8_9BILA|nr:unnamed protein product [Rotaria socialis]CAF4768145.1 unnamed protein product [Rotaria socialis]
MSQNSNNSYLFTLTTTSASFFTSVTSTTSSALAITTSPSQSTLRLTSSPSPSPSSSSSSSNKVISSDNVSQIITWILSHISFYGLRVLLQLETQFPIIGSAASSSKRLDFFCDNDKYSL